MKKLRLEIDSLKVESFETRTARAERGTVVAHADTVYAPTCFAGGGGDTCAYHCTWWPGTGCE